MSGSPPLKSSDQLAAVRKQPWHPVYGALAKWSDAERAGDLPPLKWSDLRYAFDIQEDCNGKEAIHRPLLEAVPNVSRDLPAFARGNVRAFRSHRRGAPDQPLFRCVPSLLSLRRCRPYARPTVAPLQAGGRVQHR